MMNDVQPFVVQEYSLPGTARKIGDFADYTKEIDAGKGWEFAKRTPLCEHTSVGGFRGPEFCSDAEANCPMLRELHPRRNIEYPPKKAENPEGPVVSPKITASHGGPDRALDVMIAALVIALIVSVWRR
jgi:hypothetical protein